MEIKFKKLHKEAVLPAQAHDTDGGWDVTVTEIEQISENFVIAKLGFALGLPKGHKLTLVPRSSFTKTNWILQNSPGLGDEGYRNEYQYRFRAIPTGVIKISGYKGGEWKLIYDKFPFEIGDRIGQVYLETVIPTEWKIVEDLDDTDRGKGGFGSTDKKPESKSK